LTWQPAVIERVALQTPRMRSLFLRTALQPTVAGQHLDVRLTAPDGYQAQRKYSIASPPSAGLVELMVERLDDGEVSPYFHDVAEVGDTIEVRGPIGGHFIWRPEDGGPLLLVAGGSGVVPLMAMLRWRAVVGSVVPALLLYSARTWGELAFREELLAMDAGDAGFAFVAVTTRGVSPRATDLSQRLDAASLQALLTRWGHTPLHTFVCGANRFVESVTQGLLALGLPAPTIRTERYGGA
jgi:ferredoxin-NADP reductase